MSKLLEFIDNQEEHEYILFLTEWENQKQFNTLYEIYDTPVKVVDKSDSYIFTTEFIVKDETYIFNAISHKKDVFSVGFYRKGDTMFDRYRSKGDKSFVGVVISGIFRSLKRLIDTRNVGVFFFNSDDPDLIRFYDKLSKYIELRFDFVLDNREKRNNTVQWTYRRKQ